DRLRRLEQQGVIAGYQLKLAPALENGGIRAYVTIGAEPRRAQEVSRSLAKLPQIEALHTVSGKFDIVALVRTPSAQDMDRVLDIVGAIPGVTRTESAVILSTKLDRR
ncbi:MAG: Lrp/AsnC family transcriptional regulator, partial [Aestuariivirgaceae bacterium]|nr:Lrp/AsnC family transcriptional regulator [Aestuariivirgaceae bacterium]